MLDAFRDVVQSAPFIALKVQGVQGPISCVSQDGGTTS